MPAGCIGIFTCTGIELLAIPVAAAGLIVLNILYVKGYERKTFFKVAIAFGLVIAAIFLTAWLIEEYNEGRINCGSAGGECFDNGTVCSLVGRKLTLFEMDCTTEANPEAVCCLVPKEIKRGPNE